MIIEGSGFGKSNSLFNLKSHQPDIDYLHAKDPQETKYQLLVNKQESIGLNHFNDPKAFIEYSDNMNDIHKNLKEYNPGKERKILAVFDNMIADVLSNKELSPIVTKLFNRGRKLNISHAFITQSISLLHKILN